MNVSPAQPGAPSGRETELLRRARDGDAAAYADIVSTYQRIAFRTAYLVAGADAAEEVTQVAFVKAYYALNRFKLGHPFRPWLLKIVVNEARNALRSSSRHRRIEGRAVHEQATRTPESSPHHAAVARETGAEIERALATLPRKQREVVTCRYLLDLSEAETGTVLRIPVGTVKSRLSRALEALRVELAGFGHEADAPFARTQSAVRPA